MFQRENFSFYDKVLLHSITSEIILGDWRSTYAGLSENLEMWLPCLNGNHIISYHITTTPKDKKCKLYVCELSSQATL